MYSPRLGTWASCEALISCCKEAGSGAEGRCRVNVSARKDTRLQQTIVNKILLCWSVSGDALDSRG
jgi:hypothetical protein